MMNHVELYHPSRSRPLIPAARSYTIEQSPALVEYAWMLYRRRGLLILLTLLGVVLAALVSLVQRRVYQSVAYLEVQAVNASPFDVKEISQTPPAQNAALPSESDIQTHAAALRQDPLLELVVKRLKLEQRPEFGVQSRWLQELGSALGFRSSAPMDPVRHAVKVVNENLEITPEKGSRIIQVVFGAEDPNVAATFTNTLTEVFIERDVEARWRASLQVREWLRPQLHEVRQKLAQAQEKLQRYSEASGLVLTSGQTDPSEERLLLLQGEFARAQAERIAKEPLQRLAARDEASEVFANNTVKEYQSRLTDLRRQLADLELLFKPESYKVQRVKAQIGELESALQKEVADERSRIRRDYEGAVRREQLLATVRASQSQQVAEKSSKMIQYNTLNREVEMTREVYEAMLRKMNETEVASAIRPSSVRVVGPAHPAEKPHRPNLPLNLTLGAVLGLSLAIGCVTMLEQTNRRLYVPGDVEAQLCVPELGAIPAAKRERASGFGLVAPTRNRPIELMSWENKQSDVSESFRAALASILVAARDGGPRAFVITSPLPGEGKTTVACNLGISLAEIRRRVLLIDGDMRRPRLHKVFGLSNSWGLNNLLREKNAVHELPLDALVRGTSVPNLFVLPSGPGTDSVFSLLYSDRLQRLITRFRKEFDHVLIDAPPSLEFADARTLALYVDGVILVVRADHTDGKTASVAIRRLHLDGIPVVGAILNDWNPRGSRAYGYRVPDSPYTGGDADEPAAPPRTIFRVGSSSE
jgi:capsular exopolysaccharide synthesis family protein